MLTPSSELHSTENYFSFCQRTIKAFVQQSCSLVESLIELIVRIKRRIPMYFIKKDRTHKSLLNSMGNAADEPIRQCGRDLLDDERL